MKTRGRHLPFDILYEDGDIIVIDKPAGILTAHTKVIGREARESQWTVENLLTDYLRKGQAKSRKKAWLVHRLDRGTSGVMMVAKSEETANWYRDNWHELTEKTYRLKVSGRMPASEGEYRSFLKDDDRTMKVRSVPDGVGGKLAVTRWRVVGETRTATDVEATLETGRKNQIRVQFADAGHPVVGDVKYGGKKADRLYLHAWRLKVKLRNGEWKTFTS